MLTPSSKPREVTAQTAGDGSCRRSAIPDVSTVCSAHAGPHRRVGALSEHLSPHDLGSPCVPRGNGFHATLRQRIRLRKFCSSGAGWGTRLYAAWDFLVFLPSQRRNLCFSFVLLR